MEAPANHLLLLSSVCSEDLIVLRILISSLGDFEATDPYLLVVLMISKQNSRAQLARPE